jgi:transcription initiation factor TFIIIB Brf1 subunit/transcription initiation factor TFIIB
MSSSVPVSSPGLDEKVLRLISISGSNGIAQSRLWKDLGIASRDASRAVTRLISKGRVKRSRTFENGRWTYVLKESRSIHDILEIKVKPSSNPHTVTESEIGKVRRWELDSIQASRGVLNHALSDLGPILDKLDLGSQRISVAQEAHVFLKKMITSGFSTGRRADVLMAVAIYAGCRKLSIPVHIRELSRVAWIDETITPQRFSSQIRSCYRNLLNAGLVEVPPSSTDLQLKKLFKRVQDDPDLSSYLTQQEREEAIALLEKVEQLEVGSGKDPAGMAAGIVYFVCRGRIDQETVARLSGVTSVTIRNRYKLLKEMTNPSTPWPKD